MGTYVAVINVQDAIPFPEFIGTAQQEAVFGLKQRDVRKKRPAQRRQAHVRMRSVDSIRPQIGLAQPRWPSRAPSTKKRHRRRIEIIPHVSTVNR